MCTNGGIIISSIIIVIIIIITITIDTYINLFHDDKSAMISNKK